MAVKKNILFSLISSIIFIGVIFLTQNIVTGDLVEIKKEELNNTEWSISLTPIDSPGRIAENDTIVFMDNRVSSRNLENASCLRKTGVKYTGKVLLLVITNHNCLGWTHYLITYSPPANGTAKSRRYNKKQQ